MSPRIIYKSGKFIDLTVVYPFSMLLALLAGSIIGNIFSIYICVCMYVCTYSSHNRHNHHTRFLHREYWLWALLFNKTNKSGVRQTISQRQRYIKRKFLKDYMVKSAQFYRLAPP